MDEKNWWPKSLMSNRFSKFIETLIEVKPQDNQKVSNTKEQFMAHIFNAITKSQNFLN
jgi:hypothetical protein